MPSSQSLGSGVQGPACTVQLKRGRARTPEPLDGQGLSGPAQPTPSPRGTGFLLAFVGAELGRSTLDNMPSPSPAPTEERGSSSCPQTNE